MPVNNRSSIVSFALKTLTGAVASAVLISANAAGLGKLTILSSLGQPLRAEIELTAVTPEEASGLSARLAPPDAYRTANVTFNPALSALRFEVEQRNGRQLIRVSSPQPVTDPFVDLLLELNWNGGRMVREYTFLLDPPEMRSPQSPQVAAPIDLGPARTPSSSTAPASAPVAAAPAAAAAAAPAAAAKARTAAKPKADEYTVKRGDNLTRIANQVKPVDVSLDVMLVALYRANPEAFAGKNMNRLKSGQILAVPDADAIRTSAPEGEARGVVVAHARDFDAYRAKLAGQVASSTPAKEADAGQNAAGKISAKVEEKPNAVNAARDKLTLSKSTAQKPGQGKTGTSAEDSIAKQKQVDDAAARVKELEKNVGDLEKLMSVKSKSTVAAAPKAAEPAASTPVIDATPPKRTPVIPPRRMEEPGLFEKMAAHLQAVGLAVAAVLALLIGIMVMRRRKQFVVPQDESGMSSVAPAPEPIVPAAPAEPVVTAAEASDSAAPAEFSSDFAPSASQLDNNDVDPVAEADVYIAYGRDAQAEEILKEALRSHPERHAVRLKLLEVYAARKDARSFESQASELYSQTRGQGEEWAQAAEMGRALEPGNPLYAPGNNDADATAFASAPAVAAGAAAAAAYGATDFNDEADDGAPAPAAAPMTFDGDEYDDEQQTALPQAADASVSPASVAAESRDMDFGLGDLNFAPAEPGNAGDSADETPAAASAPLNDDFNLAFEAPTLPAEPYAPSAAPSPLQAEDPSMDFSFDLPADPVLEGPAATNDALDMDITGFDIPEVPALAEPPSAPAPSSAASAQAGADAVPAQAPEFDLSGIDLDLDQNAGGAAAGDTSPAEPMSALHMEMDTKLDLAIAYQEIGDKEGARELLDEVLRGGSDEQVAKANAMKAQLG